VRLLRAAHPTDPLLDMALSAALLEEVAAGADEVARVFRPGPTVAFGRLDRQRPGYPAAAEAARRHGFAPVLRLGGGHAAAYGEGAVVVELLTREPTVAEGIERRFRDGTALVVDALHTAGVDAQVGELAGEYCPGRWSVHAGGVKLAGTAQRSVRGASLLGAVVLVEHGARVRAALVDVYAALGIAFDPRTAGAAQDVVPGVTATAVERALAAGLGGLPEGEPGEATLRRAEALRAAHDAAPARAALPRSA
jgi:lipoate-protein ligase A